MEGLVTEIRNRYELGFIDSALRKIVAEVSESHGYNVNDIYKIKSTASSKLWSPKFTKIILRLADLLDILKGEGKTKNKVYSVL